MSSPHIVLENQTGIVSVTGELPSYSHGKLCFYYVLLFFLVMHLGILFNEHPGVSGGSQKLCGGIHSHSSRSARLGLKLRIL